LNELKNAVSTNFKSIEECYNFFTKSQPENDLNFQDFSEGINSLFPNQRFSQQEITYMWKALTNGNQSTILKFR